LEFGFRDDSSFLGLDEISLTPIPYPNLQSAAQVADAISLSWAAAAHRPGRIAILQSAIAPMTSDGYG
jgi:hypothetical protein